MLSSLPSSRETPSEPEDGDDLTQRPTEPGEFADDQAVTALEDAHQLVEPAALF